MGRESEPNAQNSEEAPEDNSSGARIEKMIEKTKPDFKGSENPGAETERAPGEPTNLRPSERESPLVPENEEHSRTSQAPHRMNADNRERDTEA